MKKIFVPLDIFRDIYHNRGVTNKLEAWLALLSIDEPEVIISLILDYPEFKSIYEDVYVMCLNVEKVMRMFSKELLELDRNTVQYMIDEMQGTIDQQQGTIDQQQKKLAELEARYETEKAGIKVLKYKLQGKSDAEIVSLTGLTMEKVRDILNVGQ